MPGMERDKGRIERRCGRCARRSIRFLRTHNGRRWHLCVLPEAATEAPEVREGREDKADRMARRPTELSEGHLPLRPEAPLESDLSVVLSHFPALRERTG
ncbi:hypothetical protein BH11ARM2_BH11ARM2_29190 [soil metagenome]